MRMSRLMGTVFLVVVLSAGMAFALTPEEQQQANAELDSMAKDIAQLCSTPGFRGFLRSEIAQSKNRENIIELDEFLSRGMKQKDIPPGLDTLKNKAGNARGRLKTYSVADRLDLYIPVEAHRAKWKGGDDFLVASKPVVDEKDMKQIVAYSVRDGSRVLLDPGKAPEAVVLVIAPCEHETHYGIALAPPNAPKEGLRPPIKYTSPPGQVAPNEKGDKEEIGKYPGNSSLWIYYTFVKDDKEPWVCGDPEIEVYVLQECGGVANWKRWDMTNVNSEYTAYYTAGYGAMYFDASCSDVTVAAIWERDGGSSKVGECYMFPSGRRHCYNVRTDDDLVQPGVYNNEGVFYKSSFPYNSVYYPPRIGAWGSVRVLKSP